MLGCRDTPSSKPHIVQELSRFAIRDFALRARNKECQTKLDWVMGDSSAEYQTELNTGLIRLTQGATTVTLPELGKPGSIKVSHQFFSH